MRTILDRSHREARKLLFRPQSYFSLDLPSYFDFSRILCATRTHFDSKSILEQNYHPVCHPRTLPQLNATIIGSKDGQYAWRKYQLIHPVFYTALVNELTQRENWAHFTSQLKRFRHPKLVCASLLPAPTSKLSRNEQDIFNWSSNFADETIRRALQYKYMLATDLTHCYDSLPLPLLGQALHGTIYPDSLDHFGWHLYEMLQDMHRGHTISLPQGSALMDLIAEAILGYIDSIFIRRLDDFPDLFVLRYRDDYRIFSNSPTTARQAMRILVETLAEFDLKINLSKTKLTSDIIEHSFKPDRLAWRQIEPLIFCDNKPSIFKSLLLIHDFGRQYPNCGSIRSALSRLYQREIYQSSCHDDIWRIASVLTDIMCQNSGTWPHCIAILSKYVEAQGFEYATQLADHIQRKFSDTPHTSYLDIWLQRLTLKADPFRPYQHPLCQLIYDPQAQLWNSDWLASAPIKFRDHSLVAYEQIFTLPTAVPPAEVALFTNIRGSG